MAAPSERTKVRRLPERAEYDREVIDSILDEAMICHVGINTADGYPVVIPTIHARSGNTLYLHGSPASRLLRSMKSGDEICVTVTLIDGVVVARSAFHNSMNYRSVVVIGEPRIVDSSVEKLAALESVTDHVIAGRWAQSRPISEKELKGTLVVALDLNEASAKVRGHGAVDDESDYAEPIWAGVIPISTVSGDPVSDDRLLPGVATPENIANYTRPGWS